MRMTLLMHIAAGGLSILSGFVALYAAKGASLHRRSGIFFVYAMLTMSLSGASIAAFTGVGSSAAGGLLATYLVITGSIAVRADDEFSRRMNIGAMLMGLAVSLAIATMGFHVLVDTNANRRGDPPVVCLIWGTVAALATASDVRMIRIGSLRGTPRLVRHLWRMCVALFIAVGSLFLGQTKVFPKPIRIPALLALPVVAVLLTMAYWLWRLRSRRPSRRVLVVNSQEAI